MQSTTRLTTEFLLTPQFFMPVDLNKTVAIIILIALFVHFWQFYLWIFRPLETLKWNTLKSDDVEWFVTLCLPVSWCLMWLPTDAIYHLHKFCLSKKGVGRQTALSHACNMRHAMTLGLNDVTNNQMLTGAYKIEFNYMNSDIFHLRTFNSIVYTSNNRAILMILIQKLSII